MLNLELLTRSRPKELLAVYAGTETVEWLRGRRKRRRWLLDPVQSAAVAAGEAPFECLQRLNLRSRMGAGCACLVVVARPFYSFHREYYPIALADQLQETIEFDWDDNLFYEGDRTLHFAGAPVTGDDRLLVPVFSMRSEIYQKFHQALGADACARFTLVPSALAFLHDLTAPRDGLPRTVGYCLGEGRSEWHRLADGTVVDSLILDRRRGSSRLLTAIGLPEVGDGEAGETRPVTLYCRSTEAAAGAIEALGGPDGAEVEVNTDEHFLEPWVQGLLEQDQIRAFGDDPGLKARKLPRVVYPMAALLAVYLAFALFQVHSHTRLTAALKSLQQQRQQLEAKWNPIEERRARMARLQEDQKSLTQFDAKRHPVLQLLTLVTEITPADTWLEFFSLNDKELRLRGQSKTAVKYVSELSKVEGFENVSLVSPISREQRSDSERFYLKIDLNTEKLKKRLQDLEVLGEQESAAVSGAAAGKNPAAKPNGDDEAVVGEAKEGGKVGN